MKNIIMSKSWNRGFMTAAAASLHSNGPTLGQKLGASLYSGSVLLSVGFNKFGKTTPHSSFKNYNGNVHAEVMTLIKRWHYEKSKNFILYVVRITTNSEQTIMKYGCSRPCNNCLNLIREYGVRRVRFFDEHNNPAEIKL